LILLAVAIVLLAVSYIMTPKPKQAKPEAAKDLEDPTAEAGVPIIVIFGTVTITGGNVIGYMDKASRTYKVKV